MTRWVALVAFLSCSLAAGEIINTLNPVDLQLLENKIINNAGGIISDPNAIDNKGYYNHYKPHRSRERDSSSSSSSQEDYVAIGSLPYYDSGMSCCRNVSALLATFQTKVMTIGYKLDDEFNMLTDESVIIDEMLDIMNANNQDLQEEQTALSSLSTLAKYVSSAWVALLQALITLNKNVEADLAALAAAAASTVVGGATGAGVVPDPALGPNPAPVPDPAPIVPDTAPVPDPIKKSVIINERA